jgi:hypothetical protein
MNYDNEPKLSKKEKEAQNYFNDISYLLNNIKLEGYEYSKNSHNFKLKSDIFTFMMVGKKLRPSYLWFSFERKYEDYQFVEPIFKTKDAKLIYNTYFDKLIVVPLIFGNKQSYLLTYKNNSKPIIKKLKKIHDIKSFHLIIGDVLGYGKSVTDLSNNSIKHIAFYNIGILENRYYYPVIFFSRSIKKNKNKEIKESDEEVIKMSKNIYNKLTKYLEKADIMLLSYRTNYDTSPKYKILFPV